MKTEADLSPREHFDNWTKKLRQRKLPSTVEMNDPVPARWVDSFVAKWGESGRGSDELP